MVNPLLKVVVKPDGLIKTLTGMTTNKTPFVNRAKNIVEMLDVDLTDSTFANSSTLIYNASTGKFTIELFHESTVTLNVDGGTF